MQILLASGAAYKTHTLATIEKVALDIGYDGLELMPPPGHLPHTEAQRDTNYMTVTHAPVIHAIGNVYDQPRFKAALDASVTIAQTVKASIINIHPASLAFGGRRNVEAGIEYIKQTEEKTGITIAYEMLVDPNGVHPSRREMFQQHQAYEHLEEWLEDVKTYDLCATIDTCHAATWGIQPAHLIDAVGKHLVHVHFSDFDTTTQEEHLVPGEGQVDLKSFLQKLQVTHPNISLTAEINPADTVEEVIARAQTSFEYIQTNRAG